MHFYIYKLLLLFLLPQGLQSSKPFDDTLYLLSNFFYRVSKIGPHNPFSALSENHKCPYREKVSHQNPIIGCSVVPMYEGSTYISHLS